MLKNILMIALIALLFSACTPKIEYVYLKAEKYEFSVPNKIDPITVKIEDENVVVEKERYVSYITLLRAKIANLVSQIEDYRKVEK